MVKRIAAFLMMGQLLFGSVALPLGDYSMIKELPRMYQAYEKVVSPDEKGILDFIGDYVLNGKDLLGHNQHDRPSKSGALQFQGSPSFAITLQPSFTLTRPLLLSSGTKSSGHHFSTALSDYHPSLFHPPLA